VITETALSSAVRAAIACEMLRDLLEADVVDPDVVMSGPLMPSDIIRLHGQARAAGRRVRALGQFLAEVETGVLAPIQQMRDQLRRHAVSDEAFDAAVRSLLRGAAQ
jgi:hypothetical protein